MSIRRGWFRYRLDRQVAGRQCSTVTACGLLLALATAGLILTSPTHSPVGGSEPARRTSTVIASGGGAPYWALADAAKIRSVTETFLAGYLAYLYGQAPASQVKDATPTFARTLERKRLQVPPGIRVLHPRVVGIQVSPRAPGRVIATALVSDTEVVHYPIRLALTDSASAWRVSGLESAR
jgi:hypothetical protein